MKRRAERFRIHCLLVAGLFVASTASVILNTYYAVLKLQVSNATHTSPYVASAPMDFDLPFTIGPDGNPNKTLRLLTYFYNLNSRVGYAAQAITIASNVLTDVILLWRCYLIWGSRMRVIVLPGLLCFGNTTLGCLTMVHFSDSQGEFSPLNPFTDLISEFWDSPKLTPQSIILLCFSVGNMCSNALLTSMIAGRVFYISHQVAKDLKQPIQRIYKTAIYASLESGILYPLTLLIFTLLLITEYYNRDTIAAGSIALGSRGIYSGFVPIMGIASTLVIVRSALGIAINDAKSYRATVLEEGAWNGGARGMIDSIIDIRRREESVIVTGVSDQESLAGLEHRNKSQNPAQ
ncbi:hypothetical protein PM082_023832 [Marasmius tenuissimus]|nr:hypothetical protein PM082_023832 [Marasmius tenuissimus]